MRTWLSNRLMQTSLSLHGKRLMTRRRTLLAVEQLEDRLTPVIGAGEIPFAVDPRTIINNGDNLNGVIDLDGGCTGSLLDVGGIVIGSRHILTAAHCIVSGEEQRVFFGGTGTYQLQFAHNAMTLSTGNIMTGATAATVQGELTGLANIGANNVIVDGPFSDGDDDDANAMTDMYYRVFFRRGLLGIDVNRLSPVLVTGSAVVTVPASQEDDGSDLRTSTSTITIYLPRSAAVVNNPGLNDPDDRDIQAITIQSSAILVHPQWDGVFGFEGAGVTATPDLALITLESIAPFGADAYRAYTANDEVSKDMIVTGFGRTGTGVGDPESPSRNEYQRIRISATGGSFDLGFNGDTETVSFDASAAALETAIETLTGITDVRVRQVSAGPEMGSFEVEFLNPNVTNLAQLTADTSNLTGSVTIHTIQNAGVRVKRFAMNKFDATPLGGNGLETENLTAGPNPNRGILGAGDSGGPAFLDTGGGNLAIAGVASFGGSTSTGDSTYARVSQFLPFILSSSAVTDPYELTLDMDTQVAGNDGVADSIILRVVGSNLELLVGPAGSELLYYRDAASRITKVNVFGSADDETITIDETVEVDAFLDGEDGSDNYLIDLVGSGSREITIIETGTAGIDTATINGTNGTDTFAIDGNETTRGSERIGYDFDLEEAIVNGRSGVDSFNVTAASFTAINVNGGTPTTKPGDALTYNGSGNLNVTGPGAGIITQAGFEDVTYTGIEECLDFTGSVGVSVNADLSTNGNVRNNGSPDTFVVRRDGIDVKVLVNGFEAVCVGSSGTVNITVEGSNDDDLLVVDHSAGLIMGTITFHGNGPGAPTESDTLRVLGNGTHTATYAPSSTINGNGTVTVNGQVINFDGLEPMFVSNMASFTLTTPNAADVLLVDAPAVDQNRVSGLSGGVGFEAVTFRNVTSFIIDAATNDGAGTVDSVIIQTPLVATGLQNFTVNTGGGDDTLTVGAQFTLPVAGGAFTFNGETGTDQVIASGNVNFMLTDASLTSSAGGSITLVEVDRANLTGGASANLLDASGFTRGPVTLAGLGGRDTLRGGSGDDVLEGGEANDTLDGNGGADQMFGGAGSDSFIWDPGDGSDLIEGDDGLADVLLFNGTAAAAESFTLSANSTRLRFERTPPNAPATPIVLDVAGVEQIEVAAGGGADRLTVQDLTATEVTRVNLDLGGGDAAADTVTIHGRNAADSIFGTAAAGVVNLLGLGYDLHILNAAVADDSLLVLGNEGDDFLKAVPGVEALIQVSIDGGPGNDVVSADAVLLGSGGTDAVDLRGLPAGAAVDLDTPGLQTVAPGFQVQMLGPIESFIGSVFSDVITAQAQPFGRHIDGGGGTDLLRLDLQGGRGILTATIMDVPGLAPVTFSNLDRIELIGNSVASIEPTVLNIYRSLLQPFPARRGQRRDPFLFVQMVQFRNLSSSLALEGDLSLILRKRSPDLQLVGGRRSRGSIIVIRKGRVVGARGKRFVRFQALGGSLGPGETVQIRLLYRLSPREVFRLNSQDQQDLLRRRPLGRLFLGPGTL